VTSSSTKVNGIVHEPAPDAATLGDEIALLSDEASGLLLSHPRGLAFTGQLVTIKNLLLALVEQVKRTAPPPPAVGTARPWPPCPGPADTSRPRPLTRNDQVEIRRRVRSGEPRVVVAASYNVSRDTVADLLQEDDP
jgi:hypothetical protein